MNAVIVVEVAALASYCTIQDKSENHVLLQSHRFLHWHGMYHHYLH